MNLYNQVDKRYMLKTLEIIGEKMNLAHEVYEIYLFGSSLGMYFLEEKYRMSNDIDYRAKTSQHQTSEEIKTLMEELNVSNMGGILGIPPLEELEIVETLVFGGLTVHVPSLESFALSKLLSNRLKDYKDLENYPILDACDIEKLSGLLKEYLPYFEFKDNPSYNFNFLDDLIEERKL